LEEGTNSVARIKSSGVPFKREATDVWFESALTVYAYFRTHGFSSACA
jgi:hypothetical protein